MGKKKSLIPIGCCALEIFVLIFILLFGVAILTGGLSSLSEGSTPTTTKSGSGLPGDSTIPDSLKEIFNAASQKYNISPAFLAAIFWKEHSESYPETGPWATSDQGASGPFQFLEKTWEGWYSPNNEDGIFETNPGAINGGYGQDGNGDGIADVQNLWDAAFAAANMLAADGAAPNVTDLNILRDIASFYNSGHLWNEGKNIPTTNDYVVSVIKEYLRLLEKM